MDEKVTICQLFPTQTMVARNPKGELSKTITWLNSYKRACIHEHFVPTCGRHKLLHIQANTFHSDRMLTMGCIVLKTNTGSRVELREEIEVWTYCQQLSLSHCNMQKAIIFIYVTPSVEYTQLKIGILCIL